MNPRTILITGCSSGFGWLTAETLARKGHFVFAGMRETQGRNASAAAKLESLTSAGLQLRVIELDVTDDASVERAVKHVVAETGRIDVLVNNAGVGAVGIAEAFTVEEAQKIFNTNFFGVLRMNRAVLPQMRAQSSGLLVHVSSLAGRFAAPGMSIYCASKWALEALAESSGYELRMLGIDSVVIEPGVYRTNIFGKFSRPADNSRAAGYGPASHIDERINSAFAALLAAPDAPNPQEVADEIASLIEMPAGTRPFRVMLPVEMRGLQPVNDVAEQLQKPVLELLGLQDFSPSKERVAGAA